MLIGAPAAANLPPVTRARWIDRPEPGRSTANARIARLLGSQRGYGARWQLLEAGVPDHAIDDRVAADRLFLVRFGVYGAVPPQRTRWEDAMTAVLACGPGALLSAWSCAEHRGMVRPAGGAVHVLSPGDFSRERPGIRDHRISRLDREDIDVWDGIPCTAVALTLLDVARTATPPVVERLVDRSLVEARCTTAELADVLARHPRRPGARRLRVVLTTWDPRTADTRSTLEEEFREFLRQHALPLPRFNVPRVLPSGRRVVIDAIYDEAGICIELDARSTHDTPLRFEDDRARDLELTVLGLRPIRVTRRRLREDPGRLAAQLLALVEPGGSTGMFPVDPPRPAARRARKTSPGHRPG